MMDINNISKINRELGHAKGDEIIKLVAEKMAALEVVKKRIDDINLGCFCLELHSHKANKRGVLDQIANALSHDHTKSPDSFNKSIGELTKTKNYLKLFL